MIFGRNVFVAPKYPVSPIFTGKAPNPFRSTPASDLPTVTQSVLSLTSLRPSLRLRDTMRSNSVRSTVAPGRMDLRAARLAQPGYFLGDTIATELRGRLGRRRPQVARIVDEALHG